MRIEDFRMIFEETDTEIMVPKFAPRGSAYDRAGPFPMDDAVTLTRTEYEALIDARDHAIAMRDVASGAPTLTNAEMDAFLQAPSATAFFRKRAGLTQVELARRLKVSQPHLAQLGQGRSRGSMDVYQRLARVLGVRIEDLLDDAA